MCIAAWVLILFIVLFSRLIWVELKVESTEYERSSLERQFILSQNFKHQTLGLCLKRTLQISDEDEKKIFTDHSSSQSILQYWLHFSPVDYLVFRTACVEKNVILDKMDLNWLKRINRNMTIAILFITALTVRVMSSSWIIGLLVVDILLTRASLVSQLFRNHHHLLISFALIGLQFLMFLFSRTKNKKVLYGAFLNLSFLCFLFPPAITFLIAILWLCFLSRYWKNSIHEMELIKNNIKPLVLFSCGGILFNYFWCLWVFKEISLGSFLYRMTQLNLDDLSFRVNTIISELNLLDLQYIVSGIIILISIFPILRKTLLSQRISIWPYFLWSMILLLSTFLILLLDLIRIGFGNYHYLSIDLLATHWIIFFEPMILIYSFALLLMRFVGWGKIIKLPT